MPNEMFYDSKHYTGTNEIVEGFADFFSTTFAAPGQQLPSFQQDLLFSDTFSFGTVSDEDVFRVLRSLKEDKGMGPDGISNVFLKRSARSLSTPLAFIFNRIVSSQIYPERWKLGNMTPIQKDGDTMNLENYRGVVVQNGFGQVGEKILKAQLQDHMLKFMHPSQHGFLKNRSTLTNLLETVQKFNDVLDDGGQVDAVYFDVSKAFDKVPHSLLLEKCKSYGLSEGTINLLRTYLLDRAYQVRLNGVSSRQIYATSGVGQGSVLGPLLYLLFFNDLLFRIADWCWAFADDLKIAKRIVTVHDTLGLQQTIDIITQWCADNGLTLNVKKSKHITLSRQRCPVNASYYVNGVSIEKVSEIRDLGIIVDTRLSFNAHVDMIVRKATRLSGFVMRVCKNFNQLEPMISLFNRIVRPILEYCSPSWNPYYAQYVERIETVQHTFTRFLYRKFHCPYEPYETRISRLQLTSLSDRRRALDMSTLHRLVHGAIHCNLTSDLNYRFPTHGLRQVNLFSVPRSRTNLGKSAPLSRLCQTYNESYNNVDIFTNIYQFKRMIRE